MTGSGVATVARHEMRLRLRAGRWRWLLAAWFVVLALFTLLVRLALGEAYGERDTPVALGASMYGALLLLMLTLALLVAPALTAQSVNGDRERGTLAVLQATLLRPAEIALGKLLAAWAVASVFVLVSLPLLAWCLLEGGVPTLRLVVSLIVMILLLGVVCALAQALSALVVRTSTSAVLSYLVVFALVVGTGIAFGLGLYLARESLPASRAVAATDAAYPSSRERTDRVWWLLAPNPVVVLIDSAPDVPAPGPNDGVDPLAATGRDLRTLRQAPRPLGPDGLPEYSAATEPPPGGPVWPTGLAVLVVLGAGAFWITVRRLHTPATTLPRDARVA